MADVLRIIAASVLFVACLFSQSKPGNDDIVERLFVFNEGNPRVVDLDPGQKSDVVSQLKVLRGAATGKRLQKISFLLAALQSDYITNRNYLTGVLGNCRQQPACDEDTATLLMGLYNMGHHEVLYSLLRAGQHSDAALSELLGPFYQTVLISTPTDFMASLRRLDSSGRNAVCTLAGGGDGGGMDPSDFEQSQQNLKRVGNSIASDCLRHLENSYREAEESNKDAR